MNMESERPFFYHYIFFAGNIFYSTYFITEQATHKGKLTWFYHLLLFDAFAPQIKQNSEKE